MEKIKAGVLGATGNVGQRFIELLSNHPWFELTSLAASDKSAGKKYGDAASWRLESKIPENVRDMKVVPVDPKKVDADIVFSALPTDLAKTVEPDFAKAGFVVASNASALRMVKDIPLVIPEVNPEHLGLIDVQQDNRKWDGYVVTNPNCTTIMMAVTLRPLAKFNIEKYTSHLCRLYQAQGMTASLQWQSLTMLSLISGRRKKKLKPRRKNFLANSTAAK